MKTYKIFYIFGFYCIFISKVNSQNILTLDNAIKIALEKNYDLLVAKNDTKISNIENEVLNSGYLPKVYANAGINYSNEAQNVTFSDGSNIAVNNAVTESYNASLTAEYTIFDGLVRKFNSKKNTENLTLKKLQERQQIENTIVSIYQEYYNIAYQKQIVENLKLNIENSKDRLERTKKKLKYGQGTKLDELNAQVDLNNDTISYASAYKDLKKQKRNLNLLLGKEVNFDFIVDTTIVFADTLNEKQILKSAKANNITSLLNKQNVLLSDLDIKINKAGFLPKLSGSAGYSWVESQNPETSFALNNISYGFNLGLSLSWNIFDGGSNKTKTKKAKITKQNREIEQFKAKEQLELDVYNAYEDYSNKQFELLAENKNVETNHLNFSRTKKQYSLGQVSAVEFRQAQINLLNAENNATKAKYDLKLAEVNLLQLAGSLVR